MSLVTHETKAAAEVYYGHDICREKSMLLLTEMGLPNGLLPLVDIEECGYVKETGFVWLKQKKKTVHKYEKIGKLVAFDVKVTAFVEKFKIKKLTGVKSKELLLWIIVNEISFDDPPAGKISFSSSSGMYRSFPSSAFRVEDFKKDVGSVDLAKDGKVVEEVKKDVAKVDVAKETQVKEV